METLMNASNDNVIFLVVIYNKNLASSNTVKSLVSIKNRKIKCDIVNNGPNKLDEKEVYFYSEECEFNIFEYIENRPLSVIYNDFIERHRNYSRFVILDDDSILTDSFIDRVFSTDRYDLELPKIIDQNNNLSFPILNYKPIDKNCNVISIADGLVLSIGSGLIISEKLLSLFDSYGVPLFDRRFSLYGVDTSLFLQLRKMSPKNILITSFSFLKHDLSLNDKVVNSFKKKNYT
jgi:hypothetical protein